MTDTLTFTKAKQTSRKRARAPIDSEAENQVDSAPPQPKKKAKKSSAKKSTAAKKTTKPKAAKGKVPVEETAPISETGNDAAPAAENSAANNVAPPEAAVKEAAGKPTDRVSSF